MLPSPISTQAWAASAPTLPGNAKAKPAGYAAPAQHGMRGQRARQTKGIHPGLRGHLLRPPRRSSLLHRWRKRWMRRGGRFGPGEESRGRRQSARRAVPGRPHDSGFPQIGAADRCRLHRVSSGAATRTSRCSSSVCRNGVTSRAKVAASTSWRSERCRKSRRPGEARRACPRSQIATWLKPKYEPARCSGQRRGHRDRPTANSLSRTRMLSTVTLKAVGLHCSRGVAELYPMSASAVLVSCCRCGRTSEWPSRRKIRVSSRGAAAAALWSAALSLLGFAAADFVSVPIAQLPDGRRLPRACVACYWCGQFRSVIGRPPQN